MNKLKNREFKSIDSFLHNSKNLIDNNQLTKQEKQILFNEIFYNYYRFNKNQRLFINDSLKSLYIDNYKNLPDNILDKSNDRKEDFDKIHVVIYKTIFKEEEILNLFVADKKLLLELIGVIHYCGCDHYIFNKMVKHLFNNTEEFFKWLYYHENNKLDKIKNSEFNEYFEINY